MTIHATLGTPPEQIGNAALETIALEGGGVRLDVTVLGDETPKAGRAQAILTPTEVRALIAALDVAVAVSEGVDQ